MAGDVHVAGSVDGHAKGLIVAAASEIRGPFEIESGGFDFYDNCIAGYAAAVECLLKHRASDGKVRGEAVADEENIAKDILRDLRWDVIVVSANKGREN